METKSGGTAALPDKLQLPLQPKNTRKGRTFTGCYNCRARKVKCDEGIPECNQCVKHGTQCSGYRSKLVWVTADQKTYAPNGRRFLGCETTWNGFTPLKAEDIDHFVSLCDAARYVHDSTIEWSPDSMVPFGVFPASQKRYLVAPSPTKLSRCAIYGTPIKDEEAFLFQHYVNHVAFLMMPYEDSRNPWKSDYPSAALQFLSQNHQALYKALLAQAAYNLAYLECGQKERMLTLAASYYTSALSDLRQSFLDQQQDYGTFIASIMTLVMVEIYSGNSKVWKTHLDGAWKFSKQQQQAALTPWAANHFAESSTQSLCIIKTVGDTTRKLEDLELDDYETSRDPLIATMSSYPSFGLTIGASQPLMTSISDIQKLARDIKFGRVKSSNSDAIIAILKILDQCREKAVFESMAKSEVEVTQNPNHKLMAFHHESAFIAAAHVYLHRIVSNLPPCDVQRYVAEVFRHVEAFFAIDLGNFSLWPAFIAAVEAFEESDLESAKTWLADASKVGMGNRVKIAAVVREVWRLRESTAVKSGQPIGKVIIDWRDVMISLDLEILLV